MERLGPGLQGGIARPTRAHLPLRSPPMDGTWPYAGRIGFDPDRSSRKRLHLDERRTRHSPAYRAGPVGDGHCHRDDVSQRHRSLPTPHASAPARAARYLRDDDDRDGRQHARPTSRSRIHDRRQPDPLRQHAGHGRTLVGAFDTADRPDLHWRARTTASFQRFARDVLEATEQMADDPGLCGTSAKRRDNQRQLIAVVAARS